MPIRRLFTLYEDTLCRSNLSSIPLLFHPLAILQLPGEPAISGLKVISNRYKELFEKTSFSLWLQVEEITMIGTGDSEGLAHMNLNAMPMPGSGGGVGGGESGKEQGGEKGMGKEVKWAFARTVCWGKSRMIDDGGKGGKDEGKEEEECVEGLWVLRNDGLEDGTDGWRVARFCASRVVEEE